MKARSVAAVKVKKCEDEVQSTKSALETLEPSNFEEKDTLEAVLRIAEEAYERAFKEQQQVEMEYEEFKSQRHSPPPKKPRARTKSLAKASKRSAARAEEEAMSSSTVELFDNSLKSEPDFLS
ncbi:hypothetical protein TELCIR_26141 [Teladorsagia circumcincta]|uniref:Uncharacterized protein n=1 Tax=Teladorsagia circumcincta TaxID=45464 RepID=A0A2G9T3M6_TELCI|nr:hypothetical protein TELCIR_26141 [Teladorsagia circumcincta]